MKDLIKEYLKTTELHPTGHYKLEPQQTLQAFFDWLKENGYLK